MSYDIYLIDPQTKDVMHLEQPLHLHGGTMVVDGTLEAWLNITYNYTPIFERVFGNNGIRSIYGLTAKDSVPLLQSAISQLQDDSHPDYWKPTDGNAKAALNQLLKLATALPNAQWAGD